MIPGVWTPSLSDNSYSDPNKGIESGKAELGPTPVGEILA